MKKSVALLTFIAMLTAIVLTVTGCGGELTGHEGKYNSVAGEALGMTLTGDDISGWSLDLKQGGKGTIEIDGESSGMKWSVDGTALTVTVEGEELNGTIENGIIVLSDVLGSGVTMTFALEGSEAASDPTLGLSDEEKAIVGLWNSDAVQDVLENDASGEIPATAYTMELLPDKTAKIAYNGSDMGAQKWSYFSGTGSIEDLDVTFEMNDDGSLEVTYFEGDDYYVFHCVK